MRRAGVGTAMALVVALAIGATGTTAAEAKPGWSSPFRVSSGSIASSMTVTGSASGAVALWTNANDTLRARRIGRDGSRGPIRTLGRSDTGDGGPWIAIDRRNVAIVVWFDRSDHSLLARRLSKDNRLGPVLRIAAPDMTGSYPFRDARVAVDADGDATVAWARTSAGQTAVVTTTIDSQGAVGKVQPVSDPALPPNLAYESQGLELALDRAGRATFAWRSGETGQGALAARGFDADGSLGPQRIAASGDIGQNRIRVVVDHLGRATLVWQRGGGRYSIAAGGKLARVRTVSRRGDLRDAEVVATGPHDLLVAWTRPAQPGSFVEMARSVNRR